MSANNLISKIRTLDEKNKLDGELDLMLAHIYENKDTSLASVLRSQIRAWVSDEIVPNLGENSDDNEKYLKTLKTELDKLRILSLKIAFEPTETSIDKFSSYVKNTIADDIIIDFEIDPRIYGGAQITFNGEYRDFSLKRLFDDEYAQKETELKELVSKNHNLRSKK